MSPWLGRVKNLSAKPEEKPILESALEHGRWRQPTDTAVCAERYKEGSLSQISTCVNSQVHRLHATGQFPCKCWRSWPCQDRGLGAGRSSDGGSIPSYLMPQGVSGASLWPEKMALVLWEVCHLARTVPPNGGAIGDSEQSAQHHRRWKGDRQGFLTRITGPLLLLRYRQCPSLA